jgi:hypothetical protein
LPGIPLSVVVASTQPWPRIRICLDSLYQQAEALGAEIILVDETGRGLPDGTQCPFPKVVRLVKPGLSVYQLRAEGLARAGGDLVAITEDHCRPAPDWCQRILEAHREHPEAAMIGGGVENGARDSVVNWASYFLGNGICMPPVDTAFQDKSALQVSVAYKRRVVPKDIPEYGYMEWQLNQDLIRQGERVIADDRIRVEHVQHFHFFEACAIHYHSARSVAAFRRLRIGALERLARIAACFPMPLLLLLLIVCCVVRKGRNLGWLAVSTPMIAVLAVCRAAGAFAGLVAGPGQSPMRLQ